MFLSIIKKQNYIVYHFFDVYFAWRPLHSVAGIYILWQIRGELLQRLSYATAALLTSKRLLQMPPFEKLVSLCWILRHATSKTMQ